MHPDAPTFGVSDADAAPASAPAPSPDVDLDVTTLDSLRELVQKEITKPPIEISVPSRRGGSVQYSTELDYDRFQAWQRNCKDRSMPNGIDEMRLSLTVLAAQCVGIVVNDKLVLDGRGQPATFRSPEVQQMLGAPDANAAVAAFYANDGHVLATSLEVVRECGYGEEVAAERPDPTRKS